MASTASRAAPPPCRTRCPTQAAARHHRRLAAACFGEIVRAPPCKRRVQERSDMGLHESRRRGRVGLGLPCHLLRREDLDLSPDRLNQSGKNDHEVAGMTGFQAGVYGLFFDADLAHPIRRGACLTPALLHELVSLPPCPPPTPPTPPD